ASTYTGTTTVLTGSTVTVGATAGAILSSSRITVNPLGTLKLDNSVNNVLDRIGDAVPLTLNAGTFIYVGNGGVSVLSTETLGGAADQVIFTAAPTALLQGNNGGILPFAEVNAADLAGYNQGGNTGLAAFTGYVTSLAAAVAGDIVKLSAAAASTFTANLN